MNKFKNILILCLFTIIGILLLLQQCNSTKPKETFLKGKETIKYDTIKLPFKIVELQTKYYPQTIRFDTIEKTKIDTNLCKISRTYQDSIQDSSIVIYRTLKTTGTLDFIKTDYRLKNQVVKTINRTDTLVNPSKISIYTGAGVVGNTSTLDLVPFVGVNYKRVYVGGEYGILNKTIGIKVGFRIFKSKR